MKSSPYREGTDRLADVIAAIQYMGTYKFYKLEVDEWSRRIESLPRSAQSWRHVFEAHPEFFRLSDTGRRASLIWRRARPKLYDVDRDRMITRPEFDELAVAEQDRVSRQPLSAAEVQALISTAIELHHRAVVDQQEKRWTVPLTGSFIGATVGALVAALLGAS